MKRILTLIVGLALAGALVAACNGDDDGSGVRTVGCDESSSGSGSASGSAGESGSGSASGTSASGSSASGSASCPSSGSGSGSGSGLSASDIGGDAQTAELQTAVDGYRAYVEAQVTDTVTRTKAFNDAVRAGDLEAAKAQFASSRIGWESIEPIAALVEKIDGAVDARVDDFESEEDPTWTGWHRLEHLLWEKGTTDGAAEFADTLDADLATLQEELPDLDLTPLAMARGASELVEEVSEGKITGEEDRYSHTDLSDFDANIAGSRKVIELLTPALETADPELLADLQASFAEVEAGLAKYRNADGSFQSFEALTDEDSTSLKASLAQLSEELAEVPGALGLK
jgi:iron uptake system component EfeO